MTIFPSTLCVQAFSVYDDLTTAFQEMYDDMFRTNTALRNIPEPRRCHITTMTFVATLSHSLDITPSVIESFCAHCDNDPVFTTVSQCAFSNTCIEFHSVSMPSVRTKLFNKGAVQITGCKSHVQAMMVLSELCRVLSAFTENSVEALTMQIALINMNVTIERTIHLTKFAEIVRAHGYSAEQPERPPSCIVKIPSVLPQKVATVLVYKPGKFVICGAPTPKDVATSYRIIMQLLDTFSQNLIEPHKPNLTRRGRDHYTWTQLVRAGMPGAMHDHNPTTHGPVQRCVYCQRRGNVFNQHRT